MIGNLRKLRAAAAEPVEYALPIGDQDMPMNPLIGRNISLDYSGEINCIACGRTTRKSFNQGYCYPCFQRLAQCDLCIVRPEQCHFHQGTCREPEWGEAHCMQHHIVYLANSSGLKVGITRREQIPVRWLDQGACQALPIIRVASRFHSGLVEVVLKQQVSDRTDWRAMLKGAPSELDLPAAWSKLQTDCAEPLEQLEAELGPGAIERLEGETPLIFRYPVLEYPEKVKSLNLDKSPRVEGELLGIKGQYLILDCGVLNVRKFSGYKVEVIGS